METSQQKLISQVRQSLHDINGAFTGVMGLAEYLTGEPMSPEHKELVQTLLESCEKMSSEMNYLRSFLEAYTQDD